MHSKRETTENVKTTGMSIIGMYNVTFVSAENLRGMEVFAETRFIVKGRHSQTFKWEGYGLKLSIPEGAILSESVIYIKVGLAGQFELPPGAQLVSPIYWLYCDNDFQHPITLELQHCSSIKNQSKNSSLCFIVAECSQQELPYKFKFLDEGTFSQHSPHGSVEVEHFSLFGLVEKFVRLFVHSQPPRSCFAQLFYLDKGENAWQLDFIITWNLELYLTVSNNIPVSSLVYACMCICTIVCRCLEGTTTTVYKSHVPKRCLGSQYVVKCGMWNGME